MQELQAKRVTIARLKGKLKDGDQRELARRMDVYPARVSDALNGWVRNLEFLNTLETEIHKLLTEREGVNS